MNRIGILALLLLLAPSIGLAHHGVASFGEGLRLVPPQADDGLFTFSILL